MTTTLFSGGAVRTGRGDERADWVVVRDDVVASVGTGDAPAADRSVDLDGATLVPGFRDGHVHLPATGLYAAGMDFRNERSASAILQAFAERAEDDDALLFGGNFEEPLDAPLTAADLDDVVGTRPALLARADMHSCIVSTALIERLSLDDVDGVDRDVQGRPTGYLRERAAAEAWRWFDSNLGADQQRSAVLTAIDLAYSKGLVEVHEMFVVEWRGWASLETFVRTIDDVALEVAIYPASEYVDRIHEMGFDRVGGDLFLDGSFGSHTAWLSEPYTSPPPAGSTPTGISYRSDEELYAFFSRAHELGMQTGVHAIGDAAIDQALRAWERVASEVGIDPVRRARHRLEHFECAWDDHVRRAAHLGLAISAQPAFDRFWGGEDGLYAQRIGKERAREMNRFASMLDAGLLVGAGSDSTVTPMDPFLALASLRAHHRDDQALRGPAALGCVTSAVADLSPGPHKRGRIEPGTRADLALLDRDPVEVDPDELTKTEVLGTWIAGARVWPAGEREAS